MSNQERELMLAKLEEQRRMIEDSPEYARQLLERLGLKALLERNDGDEDQPMELYTL